MTKRTLFLAPFLMSTISLSSLSHAQTAGASSSQTLPPTSKSQAPSTPSSTDTADSSGNSSRTPTAATAAKVTDPQIVSILMAVNQGEIDEAKAAKHITKSKPIRDFADQMILEHKQVQEDLKKFTAKAKIVPADAETNTQVKKEVVSNIKEMKRMSGKVLDRHYLSDQVAMHQNLLDQIDNSLVPSVQNPELKDILTKVRASVAMHLEKAKALQESTGAAG